MGSHNRSVLYLYGKLLKLYPQSYRQEYESEMVLTMRAMLNDAATPAAKWRLLARAGKDYAVSLFRQNAQAFEDAPPPGYIQRISRFGTGLVLPFFIISAYNLYNRYVLHQAVPYVWLESKTWIVYCVIMPLAAFLLVASAGTKRLVERNWYQGADWHELTYDWLPLGLPLSLLALMALL